MTANVQEIKGIDVPVESDGNTTHVESASRWPQREARTAASIIADVLARGS
jgi:hypothetical protein